MTINWGSDPTAADVQTYLDIQGPAPDVPSSFLTDLLWGKDAWLNNPDHKLFNTPDQISQSVAGDVQAIVQPVQRVVGNTTQAIADAASQGVAAGAKSSVPLLVGGMLALGALMILTRPARR